MVSLFFREIVQHPSPRPAHRCVEALVWNDGANLLGRAGKLYLDGNLGGKGCEYGVHIKTGWWVTEAHCTQRHLKMIVQQVAVVWSCSANYELQHLRLVVVETQPSQLPLQWRTVSFPVTGSIVDLPLPIAPAPSPAPPPAPPPEQPYRLKSSSHHMCARSRERTGETKR